METACDSRRARGPRAFTLFPALAGIVLALAGAGEGRADAIDAQADFGRVLDESLLDLHGGRWQAGNLERLTAGQKSLAAELSSEEAKTLWLSAVNERAGTPEGAADALGITQARRQHVAALEMIHRQLAGDITGAREWRATILMPKYASSVEGALALQRLGGDARHREEVSRLLAREYLLWQITRAREKSDALGRLIADGRATPSLVRARAGEIEELSKIPASLLRLALPNQEAGPVAEGGEFAQAIAAADGPAEALAEKVAVWRLALEKRFPNLLSEQDVQRRENIVLKLLRLIPMEYQSGVRDGEVVIPIEYREAKSFTIQCQQIINELMPVWRETKADALEKKGPELLAALEDLEKRIGRKDAISEVERQVKTISGMLNSDFGLALKRAGTAADVVAETSLEIRALLGQSLAAAQAGQWRKAEALRLDAYVNFDLELESRAMPRDPSLALAAEKTFLDGETGKPGIKAALDARASGPELTAAYQRAYDAMDETVALLRVGLSPGAAILSAVLIVVREGLEAVVILAALLAGLRGDENRAIRKNIGIGAWLAVVASGLLFVLSRFLLQGLSKYGEKLEAVISILAVIILLMVTNWVFHKYYWTGWNAKLRQLSKAALGQQGGRWEHMALVGVGFATIFREGFETTLFMQSLILEAGMSSVLKGLAIGGAIIGVLGYAVFYIGAKLPYRKMLVYTGALVMIVLFTFLGSTTRLFQTVGWLPVHPIPGLSLPTWMGVWFGIYPTWEGILTPLLGILYVGGAWLFVKFTAKKTQAKRIEAQNANPRVRGQASSASGAGEDGEPVSEPDPARS